VQVWNEVNTKKTNNLKREENQNEGKDVNSLNFKEPPRERQTRKDVVGARKVHRGAEAEQAIRTKRVAQKNKFD